MGFVVETVTRGVRACGLTRSPTWAFAIPATPSIRETIVVNPKPSEGVRNSRYVVP